MIENPILLIICTMNFQSYLPVAAQFDLESCDEHLGKMGRSPGCPHLHAYGPGLMARLSSGSHNLVLSFGLPGPRCVASPAAAPRVS